MAKIELKWRNLAILAAFSLMLACGFLCLRTEAQVSAAKLSGTVADPSGASIADAQIEITNAQTGIVRNVTTNSSGLYNAPSLSPGTYNVKISSPGFSTEVRTGLVLDVGSDQVMNVSLKVGSATQQVDVNDIAAGVDLTTSTLNDVVDGKNVRDLPLNGRSWTDLAALTTGVTVIQTQPPVSASDRPKRGLGAQLSISGGRPQQNSYLLDGININDYSNAGPGSVLGGNLGVDAIQEFTVITTNPVAQYGRTSGGVISAITRSGTNQIHGSGYEFFRDASLDAENYFDVGSIPPFRRNQYGGSLGGPIQKNKTFIFGDFEGVRQTLGITAVQEVPTAAARAGNLTTGTVTPDPAVARFIKAFYPLPNGPVIGDTGQYSFAGTQKTTENFFTVKADHTFSQKDSAAVTYMFDDNPSSQNDELNNKVILSKTRRQLVSLLETHIFSPTTLNSAHIGFSRDNAGSPYSATAINPAAADPSFGFVPGDSAGAVQVPGLVTFSGGLSAANPLLFRWNSWQAYDDVSHSVGIHSITFGANVEYIQDNQFSADTPGGFYQFNTLSDFITNRPLSLLATEPGTITNRNLRQTIYGAYFEDDMRLRPNLTVNLAMRYEGSSIPSEINGKLSNLRVLAGNTPSLGNPYLSNPTHRNFEPRVGFAWDPFKDGKTSVRGGFGMYDILPLIVEMGSGVDASFPFAQNVTGANLPIGSFPTQAYQIIASNPSDHRLYVIQYHPPRNYVMQWNLNVQRELFPGTTMMVAYVGSRGVHMWFQTDDGNIVLPIAHTAQGYLWPVKNPDGTGSGTVIDPSAGRVQVANWSSDSYFDGLEAQLSQKVTHNLQGQVSYTWSRCIDTSSGSAASDQYRNSLAAVLYTDPRTHRGPCDTNVTQNLVVNTVWDVPHLTNATGFVGGLTNGWQISGIFHAATGQPFSVTIGGDPLGLNSVVPFDFPDRLTGGACGSPTTGNQVAYIKLQCFDFPALVNGHPRLGNGGRNELIGPGLVNMDFSIFKNFPMKRISEAANLQFRVETYNLFNHPDFAPPNDNNTLFDGSGNPVPNAGFIDQTTLTSREIQLAVKFTF
jgi:Carboxypeptidase regulatory-like domain/TonB-dependent Receptor Plug Domain/TonB dependent receptor